MQVSTVCLGLWAAGGTGWGFVDDAEIVRATRLAVAQLGVNLFDTADVYGLGRSEVILGRALEGIRHQCLIATKVGLVQDEMGARRMDLSARYVTTALDDSLGRLGTDYVDLYLANAPDGRTPLHEMAQTFEVLRAQGKLRWWCVSNFEPATITELAQYPGFVAYQGQLSLVERGASEGALPTCQAHGIGFMAYSPLAMGLLTGKYHQRPNFSSDDVRAHQHYFQADGFAAAQKGLAALNRFSFIRQVTMAQTALAWTLQNGATTAIAGFKDEVQAEENAMGAEVAVTDHEAEVLTQAFH